MTPQELKNSILQLAIQGKLVEQRPEEGTAAELYQQIQREKQALIKAGKIKKEKPLPEIAEDEVPFEIPENWIWARLGSFCMDFFSGKSPVYSKQETGYRIIGQAANQQDGLDFSQIKYTDAPFWDAMDKRFFLKENDVILNTLGNGTLGRSGIIDALPFPLLTDGHLFVIRTSNPVSSKYVYYFLQYKRRDIEKAANGSTNQTFLSLSNSIRWVFPLPPLDEQKRIVAKIEELLPLIDRYEQAWTRLEDFNKRFPEDMQKSILQMAIQGKLVEQRPEEGTGEELFEYIQAKRKKLEDKKVIKKQPVDPLDEDYPFEIPENWKWIRIGSIEEINLGFTYRPEYVNKGVYFLSVKDISEGKICFDNAKMVSEDTYNNAAYGSKPQKGDILFGRVGTMGKPQIVETEIPFCIFVSLGFFRDHLNIINKKYVTYWMQSKSFDDQVAKNVKGSAQKNLNTGWLKNFYFPLPPLAEQKRIIARLEELLPLCERLK